MPGHRHAGTHLTALATLWTLAACAARPPTLQTSLSTEHPTATAGTSSTEVPGVIVMAHGGDEGWNASVEAAVAPLRDRLPVEIAFGMADSVRTNRCWMASSTSRPRAFCRTPASPTGLKPRRWNALAGVRSNWATTINREWDPRDEVSYRRERRRALRTPHCANPVTSPDEDPQWEREARLTSSYSVSL